MANTDREHDEALHTQEAGQRFKDALERLGTEPTRTGSSLRDVLDFFPA